ncbi:tRNA lysidine(34) synthetase TilS [Nocardioides islandensis]|uniref:tRNA(Ile)-lysidine synthase n=1 Tax=Nocardioides islandensis TaxID=433663 RepID=A0A930YBU2_9ACTN|nr:tRNA lysidine(34) synthetase TilS [Nocardioides islandensis]MBF4762446.1 tRNA lysidine(34) synthetase TilS [Nocardioides islandensis]
MSGPAPTVAATRVAVRRALAAADLGSAPVLVACSGGADSLALLAAAVFEARQRPWPVVGVTVDHALRDDSSEVATRVVGQMAALGADETAAIRVSVTAEGQGLEAAARQARYAVLEEIAERFGSTTVLLGHTRDDQAETVLLGLARGSGARALAGMRREYGVFLRPFLGVTREQTEAACREQGIEWWTDPANADPRFTRTRVRDVVLPTLEAELGPGVGAALARTADQLRQDVEHLDALAAAAHDSLDRPLPVTDLAALPAAVRTRVLRLAALAAGARDAELFHEHVLALDALVTDWHGQGAVDLPGHVRGTRVDGALVFVPG